MEKAELVSLIKELYVWKPQIRPLVDTGVKPILVTDTV